MGVRFFVLNLLFAVLFGLLGLNLYHIQVQDGQNYFQKAQARAQSEKNLSLKRGKVFFTDKNKNKIPAAINKNYPIIYAVPKRIENISETASKLSKLLDADKKEITKELDNPESLFRLLVEKAKPELVSKVKNKKIDGVHIAERKYRFYPFKSLAAPLLGFVGVNKKHDSPTGLYGVERFYNKKLKSGQDIQLTVDRTLQAEAETALSKLIKEQDASGGSILIQNPKSGKILALAEKPSFNPNKYSEFPVSNYINDVVSHIYEPGSVFKPITMSAGIDTGNITPETTYFDRGKVTLNGETIENWDGKARGKITMTRVIEKSVNTGAVFAQNQIGNSTFLNYLEKFGFGKKTKIDLPFEVSGDLGNLKGKDAQEIDFATASFGQGVSVTPIQLINAYSTIANDGLLMRPYVRKKRGSYVRRRVISKDTANKVSRMMESAVEKAEVADIKGYRVAGKTGTAQIPNLKGGGYLDAYIHNFVGFAPVSNPKFTILIKINKPSADLAGRTVVPAFKDLVQFTLNYYGIPPDDIE
ncbi:MAG: peptidoglycan D,D-transpeptidase FtsI family protein [Candidatus Magasanikbacteria bacterium]